ncbi:MAG: MagZ family protein [Erysipelotrichaceae bacterium]|jgi:NTP pyrophosphatase (non-canonical NTP hydrolase)|nr:MagZ family protein [Erysipelotrichaceae bacterium]
MNLDAIYKEIQEMRVSRGWDKTDDDQRLAKFIVMEAAELLECFLDEPDENKVKGELADVLMYALAMVIDHGWDLQSLIHDKIHDVKKRYPEV